MFDTVGVVLPSALPSSVASPSLQELAERIRPAVLARQSVVPVLESLAFLFPDGGLVRGSVVAVGGIGATSLALQLVAGASRAGSWVAVVGLSDLAPVAVLEAGIDAARVVFIDPGHSGRQADVVAALIGAVDVVVLDARLPMRATETRRLASRLRERGSILLSLSPEMERPSSWSADLSLTVAEGRWAGPECGHGHLQLRRVQIEVGGRGRANRPVQHEVLLPALSGHVVRIESDTDDATVLSFAQR
ncbi:MAG: hypothetical protein WEA11_07810 [Acidimicrobiales bacterium]